MEPSCPLGTTRCIPQAKFPQKPYNKFFFCEFMDLDFVSVHKHAKKELGQYPAILASHLVNNPYLLKVFNIHDTMKNEKYIEHYIRNIYNYIYIMAKSYCVKQKKQTECVSGSEQYVKTKNGRTMMKCKCAECGIIKTKFVKSNSKGGSLLGEQLLK